MSIDRTADWTLWKDQQELNAAGYTVAELPGSDSSQSQDLELCNVKDEQRESLLQQSRCASSPPLPSPLKDHV